LRAELRTSTRGLPRELTPAQHARIRRHLALIPVYIWVFYSWTHLLVRIPYDEPVRDFVHFYVQGVIAVQHDAAALYDIEKMADIAERVLPGGQRAMYPPVYGPQVAVLFRPLAALTYVAARNLWVAVTIALFAGCVYAMWRASPRLREVPGTVALLAVASPALHYTLGFVQVSALALVCVTTGYLALCANRPWLAGFALGSLVAYKPPLGIAIAMTLVAAPFIRSAATFRADAYKSLLGAVIAVVAQLAIGAIYWGPSILPAYAAALTHVPDVAAAMEPNKFHMHSWRAFFDLLRLPGPIAFTAYVVASILTLVVALLCWRARGPLALRYSALLVATVLVDPHLYAYDLLLLVPAFLSLWEWILSQPERQVRGHSFNSWFLWLVYLCYLSPLFVTLADVAGVQLSAPLHGLLLVAILAVLRSETAA
jgi:Glycosyltransferase family 87